MLQFFYAPIAAFSSNVDKTPGHISLFGIILVLWLVRYSLVIKRFVKVNDQGNKQLP
jgi:hypothetical protein